MLKLVEKLKLENNRTIILIREIRLQGKDSYVYLEMNKTQMETLQRDYKKNPDLNINDYGEVLEQGLGRKPNSRVRKDMQKQYGWED
jgi:hypothetical protein